jgi:hypothetical protein
MKSTPVAAGASLFLRVPCRTTQALLLKQTELGFAGQIRVFFRHTRRLD